MAGEYGQFEFPPDGDAFIPRYFLGDPRPTLHKRQDNKCNDGHHQCVDIGFPGTCCPNDRYCYVDPDTLAPRCCPLELNCDSDCGSTRFFCQKTATLQPPSSTASDSPPITSVIPACCPRACPSQSFYRCEAAQGGQCCPYDHTCAGSICISSATSSLPPLVTPVDEGCTTSQSRCDDGHGCCDVSRKCTRLSGTAVCAPADFTAPGTVVDADPPATAGLSHGARAGIGVGVAIGASLITASLTFLYLRRRTRKRELSYQQQQEQQLGGGGAGTTPRVDGDGGDNGAGGDVEMMSPEQRHAGLARDYFGPNATAGPFSGVGVPAASPGTRERGVPARPDAPEDIVVPVEIDSRGVGTGSSAAALDGGGQGGPGPFELYGSDVAELASPGLSSAEPQEKAA